MPTANDAPTTPPKLKPYLFHGLDLSWARNDTEAKATCPWCDSENHFSVNIQTGLWRCWHCAEGSDKGGGNIHLFLSCLWAASDRATGPKDYSVLAAGRDLAWPDTLMRWGVAKSTLTGEWLVPGYAPNGKLRQLYRYAGGAKPRLLATVGLPHQLHGVNLCDAGLPAVYICEGPWDAMRLWEALGMFRAEEEEGLVSTANDGESLRAGANVLGVPGCSVFFPSWADLCVGKIVNLMFDNDHPRRNPKTGAEIPPAGLVGMRRVARILAGVDKPPLEINYLQWGPEGFDLELPSGCDVRDFLAKYGD